MSTPNDVTMLDWFAAHAPMPSELEISSQMQHDKTKNPHNDAFRPKLRARVEIIADYCYEYAHAMMAARSKSTHNKY